VPVLEEENGTRLPDSDKIVPWLEAKFPTPAMPATAPPEVGAKVFPAFRALLFAPDGDETVADKQAELERELATIDGHLAAAAKPFLGGATLNASDASLAPKLYHISVALPAIKGWRLPERFKAIRAYLEALPSSHAWVATDYGTDAIVAGWRAHLAAAHH
jgi:glutathione S-transferase